MSLVPVNHIDSHVLVHNNTANQQENPPNNADAALTAVQQNNGFLYSASLPVVLHEVGSKIVSYLDRKSLLTFASCSRGIQEDLKVAYFQSKSSFYYESILRFCPQLLSDPSVRLEVPQQPSTMGEMIDRIHYLFLAKIQHHCLNPNCDERKLSSLVEAVESFSFESAKEVLNTAFRANFNRFELIQKFFVELHGQIPSDPDEANQFLTTKVHESNLLLRTLYETPEEFFRHYHNPVSDMLRAGCVVLSPHVDAFIHEVVNKRCTYTLTSLFDSSDNLKEKYANTALFYAARSRNSNIVNFLLNSGIRISNLAVNQALRECGDNFQIAELLLSKEFEFSKETLSLLLGRAASHRKTHNNMVHFLLSRYNTPSKLDIDLIIPEAVKGGDVELIISLVSNLNKLSQNALGVAVINATRVRNVEMLRLLLSFDIPIPEADRQKALTNALLMRRNDEIASLLLVEGESLEQEFARISQLPRPSIFDPSFSLENQNRRAAGTSFFTGATIRMPRLDSSVRK